MKVSVSGLCRNAARDPQYRYALGELCKHLKELRDDPLRHSEFFALYVFSDEAEYRAKLAEAGQQPTTPQGQNRADLTEGPTRGNVKPIDDSEAPVLPPRGPASPAA